MSDRQCARFEEAISARADGEDPGFDPTVLDGHLARCASCRSFAGAVESLRRWRVRSAEPVPDTTDHILSHLPDGPPPGEARRPRRHLSGRQAVGLGVAAVVAVVAAFVGGGLVSGGGPGNGVTVRQVEGSTQHSPDYPGATILPVVAPKPSLTLTDTSGRPYELTSATQGRPTLVYFGYTHCPDICPINMALAAEALQRLPAAERQAFTVVFITTDPTRDTPPVMRAWLDHFNSSFVGLTGTEDEIHQAERAVGMPLSYAETVDATSGQYQVVHSGYTLLYSQDNVAHLSVDDTETPAAYAATLNRLLTHGFQT